MPPHRVRRPIETRMFRRHLLHSLTALFLLAPGLATAADAPAATPAAAPVKVSLQTSAGALTLELYPAQAPLSVENFLAYAGSGFYEKTIFHRVIAGFMVQGGGYDAAFVLKPTRAPIRNEARNGLANDRGTIAMARTGAPHSASSQFFINLVDNTNLNYPSFDGWGYAVFGRVVEGMDVLDSIAAIPTGSGGPFPGDVPQTPVIIEKVTVLSDRTKP